MRRFTRLTNGFSKKLKNLGHAVALHFMYYNFGRIHQALRGKASAVPKRTRSKESPPAGFIDLGSLGSGVSRFEIRLQLGQGVALHLVRG